MSNATCEHRSRNKHATLERAMCEPEDNQGHEHELALPEKTQEQVKKRQDAYNVVSLVAIPFWASIKS